MTRIVGAALVLALLAGPLQAQTSPSTPAPALVPAAGNPNLAVASVRMDSGLRASKIIGAGVYADPNTQLGSVDDLMMTRDYHVVFAIISVGGVIGLGGRLVAVPIGQLQNGPDGKLMLPGATKESLGAMPTFVFG